MVAPSVIQATPAAWGGKGADAREIVAPGVSGLSGAREAGLRLSTRKTQSRRPVDRAVILPPRNPSFLASP